jgi:hypothetical protein
MSIFGEVTASTFATEKVHMNMCPTVNGYRDTAV